MTRNLIQTLVLIVATIALITLILVNIQGCARTPSTVCAFCQTTVIKPEQEN